MDLLVDMLKNNQDQDKAKMAQELAQVRESGRTNMFDRATVMAILIEMNCVDTAFYLQEHKEEFMDLLILSAKY